jgi:hypothetical protein
MAPTTLRNLNLTPSPEPQEVGHSKTSKAVQARHFRTLYHTTTNDPTAFFWQ